MLIKITSVQTGGLVSCRCSPASAPLPPKGRNCPLAPTVLGTFAATGVWAFQRCYEADEGRLTRIALSFV